MAEAQRPAKANECPLDSCCLLLAPQELSLTRRQVLASPPGSLGATLVAIKMISFAVKPFTLKVVPSS